jgi:hypothetical protein
MTTRIFVWTTLVGAFLNSLLCKRGMKLSNSMEVDTTPVLTLDGEVILGYATVIPEFDGIKICYEGVEIGDPVFVDMNKQRELSVIPWSIVMEVVARTIPIENVRILPDMGADYQYGVFDEIDRVGTIKVYLMPSGMECEYIDAEARLRVSLSVLVSESYL